MFKRLYTTSKIFISFVKSRTQKINYNDTVPLLGVSLINFLPETSSAYYFSKKNVWRRPLNRLPVRKRTERALSLYGARAKIRRNGLHRICGRLHNTVYGISICRRAKPTAAGISFSPRLCATALLLFGRYW